MSNPHEIDTTYVIVAPEGFYWIGMATSEKKAWDYAIGCYLDKDIEYYKSQGWYCAKANVTWRKP